MATELTDFERLVKDMRTAQKAYFRSRASSALEAAKRLEKEVDRHIAEREAEIDGEKKSSQLQLDLGGFGY